MSHRALENRRATGEKLNGLTILESSFMELTKRTNKVTNKQTN
jgi:hypothetical protein